MRERARLFERNGFSVLQTFVQIKAFTDYCAVCFTRDHAADERAWTNLPDALRGKLKSATHHAAINIAPRARFIAALYFSFGLQCEFSIKQTIDVLLRIKDHQVVNLFADARIANRQVEFFRDGDGDATFGRAVKLG